MKLLVFSDSHGNYSKMRAAVKLHPDAKMIIFLGDGLRDADTLFDEYKSIPHAAVKGNCDFISTFGDETYLDEQTIDVAGVRIFLCHGHKYGVKSSETHLWYRAREKEVNAAFFGHTHDPYDRYFEGIQLFNPGSIGAGNYGVVHIADGKILASHGKI